MSTETDIAIRPITADETGPLGQWAAPRLKALPDYISHGEILSGRSRDGEHLSLIHISEPTRPY